MARPRNYSPEPRYALQVRMPATFTAALKTIADREMMSISTFVRHVLIERLRAEGIDPINSIKKCPGAVGSVPGKEAENNDHIHRTAVGAQVPA
jgi:hypothetical protein